MYPQHHSLLEGIPCVSTAMITTKFTLSLRNWKKFGGRIFEKYMAGNTMVCQRCRSVDAIQGVFHKTWFVVSLFKQCATNSQRLVTHSRFCHCHLNPPQAAIPQNVMEFVPERPVELDVALFTKCLRSAPSGSASGLGGCTNDVLQVCLDDYELFQLLSQSL